MVNKHARRMRAAHQSPRKPPPQIVVGAGQPAVSSTLASRTPAQLISDGRLKEALHMLVDAFRQTLPLPAHHRGESDDAPSSLVTLPAVRKQRQITTPPTALQPSKDALLVFREALRATRPLLIAPDGTALHFEAPGDLHFYQKPEPAVGDGAKASLEKEGSTDSSGDAFVSTAHANDEDLDNASGPFVDASAADFKAESKSNGAATPLDNSTLAKMLSAMDALSEAMRAVKSNPDLASRVIAHRSVHYDMDDFPALMRTVKNGKHIASPVFYVGRSRWRLKVYPNGKTNKDNGFVSVFLQRATSEHDTMEQFKYWLWLSNPDDGTAAVSTVSETEIASGHGCTRFVKHSNMDALTKNGKSILAKDGALRVTVYMLQLRREDPSLESIIASTSSNVTDNDSTKELEFAALAATSIVRGPARIVLSDLLAAVEADRSGRAASAACDDNLRKATVEWQNYARRLACVHGTALRRFLTAKLDRQIDCKTFPALHQHITQIVANALEIAQTEFSKCLDMLCLADKNAMRSELVNSSTISPLAKMAVQHVLQPRLRAALDGTDKPPTPKFSPAASDPMPVDDPLNAVIDSVCDAVVLWEEAYARFLTYVENMCTTGFFEPLISNIHDGLGRMLCKCEYSENELKMLTSIASSVATTSDEGTLNDEPAMPPPSKGIVQQLRRLAEGVGEASLSSLEKKMQDCKAQLAQFRKEQAENRTPSSAAEKHLNDLEANALRAFDEVQGQVQSLRTAMDYAAVNCATLDHQCIPTVDTKRENFKRGSAACKSLRDSCEAGTVTKSSIVDDGGTKTIVTDGTLVAVDERRCGNAHQIPTDVMLPTSVEPLPTASALPQVIVSTATLAPPPIAETTMSNLESNIMEMCFADMRGALQASAESELSGVRRMLNRGKI